MFYWGDFLKVAQDLASRASTESLEDAYLRSSVSRAYYAAFGSVKEYAVQYLGYAPQGRQSDHALLRRHLRQQGGAWNDVADKLEDLRKWRNLCDYDTNVPNLNAITLQSLRFASEILAVL